MSFETAGYQLQPIVPELVLAIGAMVLLMLGAYRGQGTTRLVTALAACLRFALTLARWILNNSAASMHGSGRAACAHSGERHGGGGLREQRRDPGATGPVA